jgi:tetratricopeptide (TPR) repeat protein
MDCPRCGEPDVSGPECARCGVILAKARPRPTRRPVRTAPEPSPPRFGRGSLVLLLVGVAAVIWALRRETPPSPPPPPLPSEPEAGLPVAPSPRGPGLVEPALPPLPSPPALQPSAVPDLPPETGAADRAAARRLASLLDGRFRVDEADIQVAEDLHARYGLEARGLLEALLLKAAEQERAARRTAEARALIERAARVAPDSVHPRRALVGVLLETGAWADAERAARAALAREPDDAASVKGLAYALLRQDRSREAIEVLESYLEGRDDAEARTLLDRIAADVTPEAGLTEQRLAHFHVRYDGEEHVEVGRAVLRVLDRHYATLARTFDYRPAEPIPVILLSRETYDTATGAPGWSGGVYDSFDGRVRIPIAGLTPALTPEMSDTLLHELTHAFVADRSRGVAPREIQEGLAQLMEGKRVEDLLDDAHLAALAEGRLAGVGGFYMAALSFVEHLHGQRGQGGINDLLEEMARTGNVDQAFEKVYGRDGDGLRREWQNRIRQRYGR